MDFTSFDKTAEPLILSLLAQGKEIAATIDTSPSPQVAKRVATRAIGYLQAAEALLSSHVTLHNSLIEHPDFIAMRKIRRQFS